MHTDFVKAALIAGWVVAVAALGYMSGTTSVVGWSVVAVLSLVPPALMARVWSVSAPSMSQTIREFTSLR